MNKKIKLIDLLNKIANNELLPKTIKYGSNIFWLNKNNKYVGNEEYLIDIIDEDALNDYIEILEDNTEEQESLGESWKEVGKRAGEWAKEFQKGFTESFSDIILSDKKDNTEEIEEIKGWGLATDYKDYKTINHTLDRFGKKINELVKAVNAIRKDLNK